MYFSGWFWFYTKLLALSIPFMILGFIFTLFSPTFGLGMTAIIWLVAFIFGFLVMVYADNDDEETKKTQRRILAAKIVFLVICSVAIACVINCFTVFDGVHNISGRCTGFIFPLTMIEAKIFFRIRLTEFLGD